MAGKITSTEKLKRSHRRYYAFDFLKSSFLVIYFFSIIFDFASKTTLQFAEKTTCKLQGLQRHTKQFELKTICPKLLIKLVLNIRTYLKKQQNRTEVFDELS